MDAPWTPVPGPDGLIHPADEAEVAAAVRWAAANGRHVRAKGAGHSPPEGFVGDTREDLILLLDRMHEIEVLNLEDRIVRVEAGIHLGGDPGTPGADGAPENSLLHQLANRYGWTLSSTGGITHQTVGGFLSTTSAGGTLQHPLLEHVVAVRLIDGRGEPQEYRFDDETGPGLAGVLPSLGLLGVMVSVTLECEPLFAIAGQEAITDLASARIDLDGPGDSVRPSLAEFLTRAEYARIEWWPQRGAERLLIWQAQRIPLQPGFEPTRYEEFTQYPIIAEALFSSIFVVFGNLAAPARISRFLRRNANEVTESISKLVFVGKVPRRLRLIAWALPLSMRGLALAAPLLRLIGPVLQWALPWLVPTALKTVLPTDDRKPGMRRGEPQAFRDWSWEGLPMDNQADDVMLWTQFTELWVPLDRAAEAISVMRAYFAEPEDTRESYRRTGLYAYELYAAPAASGWIHPGYSDGEDEWADGALRIDIYWFTDNLEDPRERFYRQFWELFATHGIGFRCHWGKEVPTPTPEDPDAVRRLTSQFPRWDDWLALRSVCDPHDVFLTDYWRARFGIPQD